MPSCEKALPEAEAVAAALRTAGLTGELECLDEQEEHPDVPHPLRTGKSSLN